MARDYEYNRDGGNGCSNPNWGTGGRGDANPDTQTERTVYQREDDAKESEGVTDDNGASMSENQNP
jgi:hypothetical protein